MSYTVLARRYRSQEFAQIIGQDPIGRTLRRAIDSDRTAHAYLFCGTRGVGKTSMARIFAKALNVGADLADAEAIAVAIMAGTDIDVIEIDGASNNKVEEARDLIGKCVYRPARCPYKIYIIDEVHMLTTQAFNALLKTMEEPPAHVKFILCTTEPNKVPATIQSRCQRFDFRAIPTPLIADHLKHVLAEEGVEADDSVIHQVARLGRGSMRDALSLLDRLLAGGDGKLTTELLEEMLGLPDQTLIEALVDAVADADPAAVLQRADDLLGRGIAPDQLLEVLIEHFRSLMLLAACGPESNLTDLGDEEHGRLVVQAARFDAPGLLHMIVLLENIQRSIKSSATARALFDAAMVRIALSEKFADAAALLERADSSSTNSASVRPRQKKNELTGDSPRIGSIPPTRSGGGASSVRTRTMDSDADPAAGGHAVADHEEKDAVSSPSLWARVVEQARTVSGLSVAVDAMRLMSFDGRRAVIAVSQSTMRPFAEAHLPQLARLMTDLVGRSIVIELAKALDSSGDEENTVAKVQASPTLTEALEDEARRIPLVRQAMGLLDARIIAVEQYTGTMESAAAEKDGEGV